MRDRTVIEGLLARRAENSQKITVLLQLESLADSPKEKGLLNAVEEAKRPYVESYRNNLDLFLAGANPQLAREEMVQTTLPLLMKNHFACSDFAIFEKACRIAFESCQINVTLLP